MTAGQWFGAVVGVLGALAFIGSVISVVFSVQEYRTRRRERASARMLRETLRKQGRN